MSYRTAARTDVGQKRSVNEDAVSVVEGDGWTLLAVADGMGGHTAGDVASEAALETFESYVAERAADTGDEAGLLAAGARAANRHLRGMVAEDDSLEGMGTTLVAALVRDGTATFVNVGDSRGYRLTDDRIEQVTVDQSLVQQLVDSGEITPEEAADHPQRNVVSQVLGTDDEVDPDTYERQLSGTVLLCSDGLTEEVPESSVHELTTGATDLAGAADALVDRANDNGGSDNVSVALCRR